MNKHFDLRFTDILSSSENVFLAWKKLRKYFVFGDIWYDEYEMAEFEAKLPQSIECACDSLRKGNFDSIEIKPLPHPKPGKEEPPQPIRELGSRQTPGTKTHLRQAFSIPVRIQVAWLALLNIIGPELDNNMPKWSFGNRLYRSMWFQKGDDDDKKILIHGGYNHSRGLIYKSFHQSWPIYRNTIRLTHRYMTQTFDDLSEREKSIDTENNRDKLYYLNKQFWENDRNERKEVFWLALDFTKFYPSITRENIISGIKYVLKNKESSLSSNLENIVELSNKLLDFTLNSNEISTEECKMMDISPGSSKFHRLPTGLAAAHFLANVAMLPIDSEVNELLKNEKKVAHFRYVDDHSFLAYSTDQLFEWVMKYIQIVSKHLSEVSVNFDKTEPVNWKSIFSKDKEPKEWESEYHRVRKEYCEQAISGFKTQEWGFLDHRYPSPLLTQMLANISAIGNLNLDLLDDEEQVHLVDELEALLMSDISEQEIRKSTRMSFAASRLTLLAKRMDYFNVYDYELNASNERQGNISKNVMEKARDKLEEERVSIKGRIKKLLLFMLDSQKERMRLWINTLEFYEKTRQTDYEPLFKLIKDMRPQEGKKTSATCTASTKKHCGGNCGYYIACLHSALAKRLLSSCAVLLSEDTHAYSDIDDAKQVVEYFIKNSKRIPNCKKDRHYLRRSQKLFTSAIEIACRITKHQSNSSKNKVNLDLAISWWIVRELGGWSNETIANHETLKPLLMKFVSKDMSKQAIDITESIEPRMNLVKWVYNVARLQKRNPFHVLCSEWTALAIFQKILTCIHSKNTPSISSINELLPLTKKNNRFSFSPYNFVFNFNNELNSEFENNTENSSLDWENLNDIFQKSSVSYNKISDDFRFQASFVPIMHSEQISLFGLGLLLSGLVRHSFCFDPIWDLKGFQYDAYFMIKRLMNRVPYSTLTSRIIEGCLNNGILNRPYYDFITIKSKSSPYDPLRINTTRELAEFVKSAMNELKRGQSVLSYRKPRQLIPIFEASGEKWVTLTESTPAHEQE